MLRLWSPRATRGHALAFLGRAADGLTEIEETLARARAACHPAVEAECLWHRAEALAALGLAGEAVEAAEESAGIAARIGHAEWTAAAHRGLGIACEAAGLPGRAESAYRRSLEAAEGIPLFRAWAAARLGAFLARQGRPEEAVPHVQAALTGGTPLTGHEARWAHAELLASQGNDRGMPGGSRDRPGPGAGRRLPGAWSRGSANCRGLLTKVAGKLQAGAASLTQRHHLSRRTIRSPDSGVILVLPGPCMPPGQPCGRDAATAAELTRGSGDRADHTARGRT